LEAKEKTRIWLLFIHSMDPARNPKVNFHVEEKPVALKVN
jgi:hypothetical protein